MTVPDTLAALRAGRLAGATRLDLRHAGLHDLPPEVRDLADTLEELDVSGNALADLPPWFGRLHRLRRVFASSNRFTHLPPVLGECASLEMVGFKANEIEDVPAAALPARLRWLILTDNRVAALPAALGRRPRLQKLMLAGNRLRALPDALADAHALELVRLSANAFERREDALPDALLALPALAWIAYAGNPFDAADEAARLARADLPAIAWSSLVDEGLLGEGASGHIHAATWQSPGGPRAVAVKRFKGAMTSDGLPRSEMAACLAAGTHPHLVGTLGRIAGHPAHAEGLVLERVPAGARVLAGPPSYASCTRDAWAGDTGLTPGAAQAIGTGVASALAHLHARGVLHGDLYAHNVLVDADGHARLSDLGAASFLPVGDTRRADALRRLDERALGHLLDELTAHAGSSDAPA